MKHLFKEAKTMFDDTGFWLCLKVENRAMARKFILEMKNAVYEAVIKLHREKRSLDANAYFWTLCGKLAAVLSIPKEDIYRDLIQNIGDNYDIVSINSRSADKFIKEWQSKGLGCICERTGSSMYDGYEDIICYYGSSTYDTAQMSRLIELVVQECQQQDIETKTPRELSLLMEGWNEQQNKST